MNYPIDQNLPGKENISIFRFLLYKIEQYFIEILIIVAASLVSLFFISSKKPADAPDEPDQVTQQPANDLK